MLPEVILFISHLFMLLSDGSPYPVPDEEKGCGNHGNDEDDCHQIDESSIEKIHVAHEISDHHIEGSPEGISHEHEERYVQEIDVCEACGEGGQCTSDGDES